MPTELREVRTDEGWDEAVPVLHQLWSHRDEAFVRSWREEDDYRLFGLYEFPEDESGDEQLVAVAGVSIQRVFHHERHLWLHDFVVEESRRGEGFGEALLDALADWGHDRDCEDLILGCTDDNDEARNFYEHQGLEVWGQVLEREL